MTFGISGVGSKYRDGLPLVWYDWLQDDVKDLHLIVDISSVFGLIDFS